MSNAPPTLRMLRARRADIANIAAKRGVRSLKVFGSVVRGDARVDSDVDFLVELESGRSVLDVSELILDLEALLGYKVDVVEIRRPSPLADRIRAQAVPL